MRITQELKDVIRSKLYKEADDKYSADANRLVALKRAFNEALLQSDEYKKLCEAREAFEAKIAEAIKDEPGLGVSGYYVPLKDTSMIPADPVSLKCTRNHFRQDADRKFNQIIIKMSYGKNYEDITTILSEYGIEL